MPMTPFQTKMVGPTEQQGLQFVNATQEELESCLYIHMIHTDSYHVD